MNANRYNQLGELMDDMYEIATRKHGSVATLYAHNRDVRTGAAEAFAHLAIAADRCKPQDGRVFPA